MLNRLFSSRTRVDLLTLFYNNPERRFYLRQIARELQRDVSGIKRELDNLEKIGLLTSEKEGNLRYYMANKAFPLFPEMKAIIFKTVGVSGSLRDALQKIGGLKAAFIYGSYARGVEGILSAIDLIIIGSVDLTQLNQVIVGLEEYLNREILYLVYDEEEFQRRRAEEDPFLTEVLKGKKVMLVGREDEL